MSRQSNIKWRIQDERELAQVARDFNRKLSRLIESNPKNKSILPQFYNPITQQLESKISVNGLKELIQTRADFNRYIGILKRFMREGAETIVDAPDNEYESRTTKWHINEMNRLKGLVNRKRKARLEQLNDIEMMSSEGSLGYTLGERFGMGLASRNQLSPTQAFTPSQTPRDINFKLFSLFKQSGSKYFNEKDQQLKQNFIRTLQRNYDSGDIRDVVDVINKMDIDSFVMKFEARGDDFETAYPPERDTEEYWALVEELKAYWTNTGLSTLIN